MLTNGTIYISYYGEAQQDLKFFPPILLRFCHEHSCVMCMYTQGRHIRYLQRIWSRPSVDQIDALYAYLHFYCPTFGIFCRSSCPIHPPCPIQPYHLQLQTKSNLFPLPFPPFSFPVSSLTHFVASTVQSQGPCVLLLEKKSLFSGRRVDTQSLYWFQIYHTLVQQLHMLSPQPNWYSDYLSTQGAVTGEKVTF